jgi:hypothetical protein
VVDKAFQSRDNIAAQRNASQYNDVLPHDDAQDAGDVAFCDDHVHDHHADDHHQPSYALTIQNK